VSILYVPYTRLNCAFHKAEQACPNRYVRISILALPQVYIHTCNFQVLIQTCSKTCPQNINCFQEFNTLFKVSRLNTCISSIQDSKARLIDTSIHHLNFTPALYSSRVMQMVAPIGHGLGDYNIWVLIFISHLKNKNNYT